MLIDKYQISCRTSNLLSFMLRKELPIVLVGMMGAGKSTVARQLSAIIGLVYVDIDQELENLVGCSITEYFTEYGEQAFRQFESLIINDYLTRGSSIIALGGGAFIQSHIKKDILNKALCIYLDVPVHTLWQRVKCNIEKRPIITKRNAKQNFFKLHIQRASVYAEAHIRLAWHQETSAETAQRIKHILWHKFIISNNENNHY